MAVEPQFTAAVLRIDDYIASIDEIYAIFSGKMVF